jgi:hypothetical protein
MLETCPRKSIKGPKIEQKKTTRASSIILLLALPGPPPMRTDYWIAFIDLLGFSAANQKGAREAEWMVDRLLSRASKVCAFHPQIKKSWFSDTLILYAPSTLDAFYEIEYFATTIFLELLKECIPARGALIRGELHNKVKNYGYMVEPSQVTFGAGIVAAYKASEKQNQIAFSIHAPISEEVMEHLPKRYVIWAEPFDDTNCQRYSLLLGTIADLDIAGTSANGIARLAMDAERNTTSKKVQIKYGNTIQFIRQFDRSPSPLRHTYPLVLGVHTLEDQYVEASAYRKR